MIRQIFLCKFIVMFLALVGIFIIVSAPSTFAVSGSDWRSGNIIDDSLFYDNSSMTVSDIQAFLNSRVATCDTNGTQSAADVGYPNMNHAQYAAMRGWAGPPYVCLKDYYQVPDSSQIKSNFQGSIPTGAISAAEIIKRASDTYSISPKALLATLQKESLNLIYDSWPMLSQYKNAMGYACPDTAPCDPQYAGFYNQMHNAARQFDLYRKYSSSYRYKPFQTNSIYFNPNYNCGATNVYVENYATAGLYNYTPYQPNQAALNNLYGTGDGCSAYGNRNFWRLYNDWFGSSSDIFEVAGVTLSSSIDLTPVLYESQTFNVKFSISNSSSTPKFIGSPFVVVRGPSGQNRDIPLDSNITIPANSTYTYNKNWQIPETGWHKFSVALYREGIGYSHTAPKAADSSIVREFWKDIQATPIVSSAISISESNPAVGQNYTASFELSNPSPQSITIPSLILSVRGPSGQNRDIPIVRDVVIPAQSKYTFRGNSTFREPGRHTFIITGQKPGEEGWSANWPNAAQGVQKNKIIDVSPNPIITTGLSINPSEVVQKGQYTASFTITNNGDSPVYIGSPFVVVRGPEGQNRDIPLDKDVTIPARSSYTYSKKWLTNDVGWHQFSVVTIKDGKYHWDFPVVNNDNALRNKWINVRPSTVISTSLEVTPAQFSIYQNYRAKFILNNGSDSNEYVGSVFVRVRGPQGQNHDVPLDGDVTIPAHSSYIFDKTWFSGSSGWNQFSILTSKNGNYNYYFPVASTDVSRQQWVNVLP